MPTYEQAIARLGEALTFGINPSLDGIRALTEALGRPQDALKCIQVTGTNGKTSLVRMTGALLTAAGHVTGTYTSPHLVSYTERFAIDGVDVTESELAEALDVVFGAADSLGMTFTEFELLTAAALQLFGSRGVEWAVLEVGMGGRWDATSVVVPKVAVITGIGLDHTDRLGTTREEIAADKAHIIKEGSSVVIGPGCDGVVDVFERRAAEMGSPLVGRVGIGSDPDVTWRVLERPHSCHDTLALDVDVRAACRYRISLVAPTYQAPNIATAVTAACVALLEVSPPDRVSAAFRPMTFPGRFELLRSDPPLVIDGAHNPQAAETLATAIDEAFGANRPVVVLAILADKDAEGIVRALAPVAHSFIVTENGSSRCMTAGALADVVERVTGVRPSEEPVLAQALASANRSSDGVVATGSLYTAGAVRALFVR